MTLLLIAYVAGALTILSPCILPVLPFVLARTDRPVRQGLVPTLVGLAAAFAGAATLAAVGGGWAVQASEAGRSAAIALLALSAVTLLSRRAAALVASPLVRLGDRLMRRADGSPTRGPGVSLLHGFALGFLWAPCAGPVLGLVLTGAALNGPNVLTTLSLAAYGAGAATSLAAAALGGRAALRKAGGWLGAGERLRKGLGVAMLAALAGIAAGLDTGLLARLSLPQTTVIEDALLTTGADMTATAAAQTRHVSDLPILGRSPSFDGAVDWLNGPPLTEAQLRGKVVLVHFWTYSCINCIRSLPHIRAWAERYRDQGLVVVGVHTPEFAFEKRVGNVARAIERFGLPYTVAVDSDFRIWRAFRNRYWPAQYLIDADGRIRLQHFGEGEYQRSERAIQDLLAEAGKRVTDEEPAAPRPSAVEIAPDLAGLRSGETYLGYEKAENFVPPGGLVEERPADYAGARLRLNQWSLSGRWTVLPESARLSGAEGAVSYRFKARDLHLVLGPSPTGRPVRFVVTLDGKAPGVDRGADIDADGRGIVTEARLYQLARQAGRVDERTFEIRFLDPDVEVFAFTFG